jgi:hypothetical protein
MRIPLPVGDWPGWLADAAGLLSLSFRPPALFVLVSAVGFVALTIADVLTMRVIF